MKPRTAALAAMMILLFGGNVLGAERDGVSYPDEITVNGNPLILNGLGTREATIFKVNVYVAALYLEQPSSDGYAICGWEQTKRLVLHFVRNVGQSDITDAWTEGFEKNAGDDMASLQERIDTLNSWMTQMRDGDTMTFTYQPGTGLEVSVKGTVMGTIPGSDFQEVFFSIWLGDHPPNGGLREGLLGLD